MKPTAARSLVRDLAFSCLLVLIAAAGARLTQGSLFWMLVIVQIAGYSLEALVRLWRNSRISRDNERSLEVAETLGRPDS